MARVSLAKSLRQAMQEMATARRMATAAEKRVRAALKQHEAEQKVKTQPSCAVAPEGQG